MIEASFSSKLQPGKIVQAKTGADGLLLFNGRYSSSFFEVLSLRGSQTYIGKFIVNGDDLLDVNNANRDRSPVSVISSTSMSFTVSRSQVPLGVSAKTDQIDAACDRYLEESSLNKDWQINFTNLLRAIYSELCAHPFYIALDLTHADKSFAYDVVDLISKVLSKYRIYVFASQLFANSYGDITIYSDIKTVLNPPASKPDVTPYDTNERSEAMSEFISDLAGGEAVDPKKKPAKAPKEKKVRTPEATKRLKVLSFIVAAVFLILAIISPFLFLSVKKSDSPLYFIVSLIVCLLLLIISAVGLRFINKNRQGTRIRDDKILLLALAIFPTLSILTGAAVAVDGLVKNLSPNYFYWLFSCLYILNSIIIWAYIYINDKVFIAADKKGDGKN